MSASHTSNKKSLAVAALRNGTVIDHIPESTLFKAVRILGIENLQTAVTIGNNLESSKLGKKGIIKVSDVEFDENTLNRIAIVAPKAKINIIRDYEVTEKREVVLPDRILGIVKCPNPKCITNNEPMPTLFHVVDKDDCVIKCHYCEKEQKREEIEII